MHGCSAAVASLKCDLKRHIDNAVDSGPADHPQCSPCASDRCPRHGCRYHDVIRQVKVDYTGCQSACQDRYCSYTTNTINKVKLRTPLSKMYYVTQFFPKISPSCGTHFRNKRNKSLQARYFSCHPANSVISVVINY